MREALLKSADRTHIVLADMLPNRSSFATPNEDAAHGQPAFEQRGATAAYPAGVPLFDNSEDSTTAASHTRRIALVPSRSDARANNGSSHHRNNAVSYSQATMETIQNSQNEMAAVRLQALRLSGDMDNATADVRPREYRRELSLDFYRQKSRNSQGLCVIITNFTHALPGYDKDILGISNFFQNVLGYKVFGHFDDENISDYQNLSKAQFMETLANIQSYLNHRFSNIDRLMVFVLSHGDKKGIKTCAGGGREEYGERITADEIVNMFTHDKVKSLHGMPKCFFLQHCRGTDVVRTAGQFEDDASADNVPPQTAIGADTALFYAANLGCESYVTDQNGSWFVEQIVKLFREFHDKEHVIDIMHEVNNKLSTKRQDVGNRRLHQMPRIETLLTKKFYLTIPRHLQPNNN